MLLGSIHTWPRNRGRSILDRAWTRRDVHAASRYRQACRRTRVEAGALQVGFSRRYRYAESLVPCHQTGVHPQRGRGWWTWLGARRRLSRRSQRQPVRKTAHERCKGCQLPQQRPAPSPDPGGSEPLSGCSDMLVAMSALAAVKLERVKQQQDCVSRHFRKRSSVWWLC